MSRNATIDDTDISSVETAINSLLDQTQSYLGYAYQNPGDPTNKPHTVLSYRIRAEIEVDIASDWKLFDGFTLRAICLKTQMAKASGRDGMSSRSDAQGQALK